MPQLCAVEGIPCPDRVRSIEQKYELIASVRAMSRHGPLEIEEQEKLAADIVDLLQKLARLDGDVASSLFGDDDAPATKPCAKSAEIHEALIPLLETAILCSPDDGVMRKAYDLIYSERRCYEVCTTPLRLLRGGVPSSLPHPTCNTPR